MPFPNSIEALKDAGYVYTGTAFCRKCRAEILWFRTPVNNRPIPIDRDGTKAHWASCPHTEYFKTKRR
jgi:hypothetical protein